MPSIFPVYDLLCKRSVAYDIPEQEVSVRCRLVTVGEDESLALRGRGTVRWVREEALGSVTGSLFLDLPAPSPELAAKWRSAAPTLSERIQAEFFSIKVCCVPDNALQ